MKVIIISIFFFVSIQDSTFVDSSYKDSSYIKIEQTNWDILLQKIVDLEERVKSKNPESYD